MRLSIKNARLRVKRGIEELDRHDPYWRSTIDRGDLDMSSQAMCLLGQWAGGYLTGLGQLIEGGCMGGRETNWAVLHGFDLSDYEQDDGWEHRNWETLLRAWLEVM